MPPCLCLLVCQVGWVMVLAWRSEWGNASGNAWHSEHLSHNAHRHRHTVPSSVPLAKGVGELAEALDPAAP